MERLINAITDIMLFFEYYSFFYVALCRDFREKSKKRILCISICIMMWFLGAVLGYNWGAVRIIPISKTEILSFFIIYMLFEIKFQDFVAMIIAEWLLLSIMVLSLQMPLEKKVLAGNVDVLMYPVIILVIIWILYFIFCRKSGNNTIQLSGKIWWIIDAIMLILTAMMTFFAYVVIYMIPDSKAIVVGRFLIVFGSVFICILLFVLIYYYNRTQSFRFQKELVEIQNEQQRNYFKGLLKKEEETRNFRHDIINDLLEMKHYSTKHEYDKLDNYLDSILGAIMDISKSSYDVGNDIVNTVLNYYLQSLKDVYDIEVTGYMGNDISIEERDLCIVCANLIKNATEAVCKMKNGDVFFNVEQGEQYLSITVENSYDGNLSLDKNGKIITQKNDKKNHGIGIRNVKEIVENYEGSYETDISNNIYRVKVILKLI